MSEPTDGAPPEATPLAEPSPDAAEASPNEPPPPSAPIERPAQPPAAADSAEDAGTYGAAGEGDGDMPPPPDEPIALSPDARYSADPTISDRELAAELAARLQLAWLDLTYCSEITDGALQHVGRLERLQASI